MYPRVFFVLSLIVMSNCTYSLARYRTYARGSIIELNDKVGNSVDDMERSEYDLFPGVKGFKEAVFFDIPDGGYEIQIITEDGKYLAVNRDSLAVDILKDYFMQYDTRFTSPNIYEDKWGIVDYDALGFPITNQEVSQVVKPGCCIGAMAGGALAFGVSLILAMDYGLNHLFDADQSAVDAKCTQMIVGGTVLGVGAGILIGRMIDDTRSVGAIKRARMPKRVE
jgi:hypothetical protein